MEFSITLTEQELDIVSSALMELPFKVVAPLIQKIAQQVQQVNAPAQEVPAPEMPAQ